MTDNGAGQRGWLEVGRSARAALGETWVGLAEVCYELSDTEWALPTECPGWDVKDQLSHVIAVERTVMGEPAPVWDGPAGRPREERLRPRATRPGSPCAGPGPAPRCGPSSSR